MHEGPEYKYVSRYRRVYNKNYAECVPTIGDKLKLFDITPSGFRPPPSRT